MSKKIASFTLRSKTRPYLEKFEAGLYKVKLLENWMLGSC